MPKKSSDKSADIEQNQESQPQPENESADEQPVSGNSDETSDAQNDNAEASEQPVAEDAQSEQATEDETIEEPTLEETEIALLKSQNELLSNQLEKANATLEEAKRDLGYAKAETQTAMRRGREDQARAINRAKRDLFSRLINMADTFQKTTAELEAIDTDEATGVIASAVQLAIKEFDKTLKGEGLEVIDPKGEKFDPNFHEAQAMIPAPDAEPETVIEVLRLGYQLDGTLLRAAQVVVVAKAPEPDPADAAESEES